jgi:flagellar biosynthetic protein FliR
VIAADGVDLFAPGMAVRAVLIGTRISAMLLVAPVFSVHVVPRRMRVALAVLLTLLMLPAAAAHSAPPTLTLPALATEAAIGLLLGAGAAVLIVASEIAGDVMSIQVGLSGAALLDPLAGVSTLVITPLVRLTTLTLLLSLDLHAVMLDALADSLSLVPPGTPGQLTAGLAVAARAASTLFVLGVQFAAPVIASSLLVTLALALLTRASPQFNLFAVAFPVQIGTGLVTIGAALAGISATVVHWRGPYRDLVARVLGQLATT